MDCLREPRRDSLILKALDLLYRMDYAAADSMLRSLPEMPAKSYFRGLVLVNRFNDLGDTAALFKAETIWSALERSGDSLAAAKKPTASGIQADASMGLYLGLTELQLSYVAGVTGRRLRAARLGRKAVVRLQPYSDKAEAQAALALYDYYKASMLKGVAWIPFVKADQETPLARLETSIPRSRYLREILQTTLLWLYYDRGRFDAGLALIDAFLARYPGNRLYRQMEADFRFRKGDVAAARSIHEGLQREYAGLSGTYPAPAYLPIGYLSSVGNLAKIYASQNQPELRERQLAIWHASESQRIMDWLPGSLKREVSSLKK